MSITAPKDAQALADELAGHSAPCRMDVAEVIRLPVAC
jgi:hypothetical protein